MDLENTLSRIKISQKFEPSRPLDEWSGSLWVNVEIVKNREAKIRHSETLDSGKVIYLWVRRVEDEPMFFRDMSERRAKYWSQVFSHGEEFCITWGGNPVCLNDITPKYIFSQHRFAIKIVLHKTGKSWYVINSKENIIREDPEINGNL